MQPLTLFDVMLPTYPRHLRIHLFWFEEYATPIDPTSSVSVSWASKIHTHLQSYLE